MIILGIETSTATGSVALVDCDTGRYRPIGQISKTLSSAHSEKLIPYIEFLLGEAGLLFEKIDLVSVSLGPGSFTGLRVGLSTAKGLCLSKQTPIVGVDSLMACAYPSLRFSGRAGAFFDAKRGEVFGAAYCSMGDGVIPKAIFGPEILTLERFLELCESSDITSISGDIFHPSISGRLPTAYKLPIPGFDLPNALSIAMLGSIIYSNSGADDTNSLSPMYLRDFLPGEPRC